jgi:hypothetical protein
VAPKDAPSDPLLPSSGPNLQPFNAPGDVVFVVLAKGREP